MKILRFTVPVVQEGSLVVQEDILPYFYNFFHRHTEAQVTLIIKGSGTLIAGNYTQAFSPGDVYILGANQPHIFKADPKYFNQPKPDNIHAIHVYFNLDLFSSTVLKLSEFSQIQKFIRTTYNGFQLPKPFAQKAAKNIQQIRSVSGLKRLLEFIQLLNYFSTEVEGWKSLSTGFSANALTDTEGMRINDIYQYSIDHHAEKISLRKIAEVAHVTPHAFCKYFKKHTRKTYMSFLNEIRINEACKKIIAGNFESIATVGYAVGFNNPITFNRVFKKTTGITPTAYIKKYKRK